MSRRETRDFLERRLEQAEYKVTYYIGELGLAYTEHDREELKKEIEHWRDRAKVYEEELREALEEDEI